MDIAEGTVAGITPTARIMKRTTVAVAGKGATTADPTVIVGDGEGEVRYRRRYSLRRKYKAGQG